MDPVYWILIAGIVLGAICLAGEAFIKHLNERDRIKDNLLIRSMARRNTWDDDWLQQLSRDHYLVEIKPCKGRFFGKGPLTDGFQWVCKCGAKKGCVNLRIAEHSFDRHCTLEKDKALAAIGRFK